MKFKHHITAAALAFSLTVTGCGAAESATETIADGSTSDGYVIVSSDKDYAPLYSEPSSSSERIAQMQDKKPVTVYNLQNGWYYVSYNGQRGYVQESSIAFTLTGFMEDDGEYTEPPATTTVIKTTVTTTTTVEETDEADETTETEETEETAETEETTTTEEEVTETEAPATEPEPEEQPQEEPVQRVSHYTVFVCEADILKAAGLSYTEYVDFCTLTNLSGNNGQPTPVLEPIAGESTTFYAMRGVRITNVLEGQMSISGTLTLHSWEWANEEHTKRKVYDEKTVDFTFTMNVG